MTEETTPNFAPQTIGANNPPSPILPTAEEVAMSLLAKHADLFRRADELIAAKMRLPDAIPLDDPEDGEGKTVLGRVSAMVVALRNTEKALDTQRDMEKRPFDLLAKATQNLFKPKQEALTAIKARCEGMINARNRAQEAAERERRIKLAEQERQVEQDRLASAAKLEAMGHAEVAATVMDAAQDSANLADRMEREAGGTAADLVRTRTDGGTVSSVRTFTFEITDNAALRSTLGKLADHVGLPELEKAIRSFMTAERKAGRQPELTGVTFIEGSRASVRG